MPTSSDSPLRIAHLCPLPHGGRIGITFCPGKKQQHDALTGAWDRDLELDLDAVQAWGAALVLTLLESHELERLGVPELGRHVADRHMAWVHLPIRDIDVPGPAFEHAWRQEGPRLRGILRQGFDVLVHCKGGLGRAGTIAARLAVELGMPADEAIMAVRRARGSRAIETRAQEEAVRAGQPRPEAAADRSPDACLDRAVGCLLGLAVGDAVGTTLEFQPRDHSPRLADMVGGGPFRLPAGTFTDDSAMALALADSLFADPDLDPADLMRRFVSWRDHGTYSCTGRCFDIGVTTDQALSRWQRTGDPLAGSTDPASAGNGSLMRLAPVALRHWKDRERLRRVAALQSRTTHAAPEAVAACVLLAEILADAIEGRPLGEVLRRREGSWPGRIRAIAEGSWRGRSRADICSSGYVAHTLEAALWAFARGGSFPDSVLLAANLGDDADTVAAVTGQIAGAFHGLSGIPEAWRSRLAWSDRFTTTARSLAGR